MVAIVWQFQIRQGKSIEFEGFYGVEGEWTRLSRRSRSFLGSSFLKDVAAEGRYLLVEYWSDMVVHEKHRTAFEGEVRRLEAQRERFVEQVDALGVFTALDVPDRTGPTWSRRSRG